MNAAKYVSGRTGRAKAREFDVTCLYKTNIDILMLLAFIGTPDEDFAGTGF